MKNSIGGTLRNLTLAATLAAVTHHVSAAPAAATDGSIRESRTDVARVLNQNPSNQPAVRKDSLESSKNQKEILLNPQQLSSELDKNPQWIRNLDMKNVLSDEKFVKKFLLTYIDYSGPNESIIKDWVGRIIHDIAWAKSGEKNGVMYHLNVEGDEFFKSLLARTNKHTDSFVISQMLSCIHHDNAFREALIINLVEKGGRDIGLDEAVAHFLPTQKYKTLLNRWSKDPKVGDFIRGICERKLKGEQF